MTPRTRSRAGRAPAAASAAADQRGHRRPEGLLDQGRGRAVADRAVDEVGAHLVERGREFGTTTGRRRRCGWFDFVPLRHAVQVNSVSSIMLNKLDILSGLDEIKVCVGVPRRRRAGRRLAVLGGGAGARRAGLRDVRRLDGGSRARAGRWRAAGSRARPTWTRSRSAPACPSRSSASGPERTQTIAVAARPSGHRRRWREDMAGARTDPGGGSRRPASTRWRGSSRRSRASSASWPRRATRSWPMWRDCAQRRRLATTWTRSWRWPEREAVDLVVVGPEAPLVAGLADLLAAAGIAVLRTDGRGRAARRQQGLRREVCDAARRADGPRPRLRGSSCGNRICR